MLVLVYLVHSSFLPERIKRKLFSLVNNYSQFIYYFVSDEGEVERWLIFLYGVGYLVHISIREKRHAAWK